VVLIGVDSFSPSGPPRTTKVGKFTPIDNCIEYEAFGNKPCDSGFVIGEFFENEDVDIRLSSDIKKENYIYPVCVREFCTSLGIDMWNNVDLNTSFLDFIPKKTLDDIKSGLAKLLVYYGYEENDINGDSLFRFHDDFVRKLNDKKVPLENVIYSDGNIILHQESDIDDIKMVVSNYCLNSFYRYAQEHKKNLYHTSHEKSNQNRQKWENTRKRIRNKHFMCYNRIPKPHRALIVLSLFQNNNLDKGYVSFPDFGMSSWDVVVDKSDYIRRKHYDWLIQDEKTLEEFDSVGKKLTEYLPLELDKGFDICHSITHFNLDHYLDSYFVIVTESHCTNTMKSGNALAFTEKTWKPIMNLHPFILVANKHSLKHLRNYGFKTFSPFIDESYDDIDDVGERILAIQNEVDRLCKLPIKQLHDWYWSIEDILKHNYYHFHEKFADSERKRFLDEINF
jgi:hypothetical protein